MEAGLAHGSGPEVTRMGTAILSRQLIAAFFFFFFFQEKGYGIIGDLFFAGRTTPDSRCGPCTPLP